MAEKKLDFEQLDKVNGGRYDLPTEFPTSDIPYAEYVGTTVCDNGRNCKVANAFKSTENGVVAYYYTLQYSDNTTRNVDLAAFEKIIADSPVFLPGKAMR